MSNFHQVKTYWEETIVTGVRGTQKQGVPKSYFTVLPLSLEQGSVQKFDRVYHPSISILLYLQSNGHSPKC